MYKNLLVKLVSSKGTCKVVWLFWKILNSEFKWIANSNSVKTSLSPIPCVQVIFLCTYMYTISSYCWKQSVWGMQVNIIWDWCQLSILVFREVSAILKLSRNIMKCSAEKQSCYHQTIISAIIMETISACLKLFIFWRSKSSWIIDLLLDTHS